MYSQVLLVTALLSAVLSSPLYNPVLSGESKPEETQTSLEINKNPTEVNNDVTESSQNSAVQPNRDDLMGQETFYPVGGVWWGVRPWGGWGGYRPWYGWHGWHRPYWGGHWGGHWGGGHWGGGHWGGPWAGQSAGGRSS